MHISQQRNFPSRHFAKAQSGFALLSALLALVVVGFITSQNIQSQQIATELNSGKLQGELLVNIARGANRYAMENYGTLQNNTAVTRNGVTLAVGTDQGQTLAPTVANLIAMGYLTAGTDSASRLGNGVYRVALERLPVGCVATACQIPGRVYIDQPIRKAGSTEMAGLQVGAIMEKVGADVLISLDGSPTVLSSTSGTTYPNPVTATPVGVVGHRIGFGAIIFDDYLIVNDPRDPNFQGNFTVAGTSIFNSGVTVNGNTLNNGSISATGTVGSLDALSACIRAGFLAGAVGGGGSAFVTNSACVKTVDLDGQSGVVTASGAIEVRSGGVVVATLKPDGTIVANSRTEAPTSKVTASFAPNTACAAAAANDIAQNSASPGLVVCRNNLWTPVGLTVSAVGSACTVLGAAGVDMTGLGLYCQGGIWIANADRFGHFAEQDSFVGHHGMIVGKPSCPSNGLPHIQFTPTGAEFSPEATAANNMGRRSTYFLTQDNGATWTLRVVDASSNGLADGQGLAKTGCWYN
jgi:hypothetical protein